VATLSEKTKALHLTLGATPSEKAPFTKVKGIKALLREARFATNRDSFLRKRSVFSQSEDNLLRKWKCHSIGFEV